MMAPTTMAQRRSAAIATACESASPAGGIGAACSLHGAARQVDEEVEDEEDRHHDRRRDAGDREGARRAAATISSTSRVARVGARSRVRASAGSFTREAACAAR